MDRKHKSKPPKLKPPVDNAKYEYLEYGSITDLQTLRIKNPYYYNIYYHTRDLDLIGEVELKGGIRIKNRQLLNHVKLTLSNVSHYDLDTPLSQLGPYHPLKCLLCGMFKDSMMNVDKYNDRANIYYKHKLFRVKGVTEEVSQKYTSFLTYFSPIVINSIRLAVKNEDGDNEGFFLLLCCFISSEFRTLIMESNVEKCNMKLQSDEQHNQKNQKSKENNHQPRDTIYEEIMKNLQVDLRKLYDQNLLEMNDDEVSLVDEKFDDESIYEPVDDEDEESEEDDDEEIQISFPLFKPVEYTYDDSDEEIEKDDQMKLDDNSDSDVLSESDSNELLGPPILTSNGISQATQAPSASNNVSELSSSSITPNIPDDKGFTINEQDYQQFFYDSTDQDTDFIEMVETLSDLFPRINKSEIKIRLKIANRIEELIEELFIDSESIELIEQEHNESEQKQLENAQHSDLDYDDKVYQLFEIFPNLELSHIDQQLRRNNYNIEETTISLLADPIEAIHLSPRSTTTKKSVSKQNTINEWNQPELVITKIKEIFRKFLDKDTRLNDADIAYWAKQGGLSIFNAITGVILNCRPEVKQQVHVQRKVGGASRVQRGGGRSRVQRGGKSSTQQYRTEVDYQYVKTTYKFNPKATESIELKEMYESNVSLKKFSPKFMQNALEFFQGNHYTVIEFMSEISNLSDYQPFKPQFKLKMDNGKVPEDRYITLSRQFNKYRKPANSSLKFSNVDESSRFNSFVRNGVVDLHNLRVPEALRLTRIVLEHWWDEETRHREVIGKLDRFNYIASLGSISIITGRGIHSSNGVSIIRKMVKDHLTRNKYVYNEEVGKFEVLGKRR